MHSYRRFLIPLLQQRLFRLHLFQVLRFLIVLAQLLLQVLYLLALYGVSVLLILELNGLAKHVARAFELVRVAFAQVEGLGVWVTRQIIGRMTPIVPQIGHT